MTPRPTWRLLPCGAGFPKTVNVKLAVTFAFRKQRKPLVTSLQSFASRLPALLTVLALLGIQGLDNTDPEGSAHEDAENRDNEKIGLWIAVLRVVKPWPAVVDVFASHDRTRERAHAQQYAVPGMPCQSLA